MQHCESGKKCSKVRNHHDTPMDSFSLGWMVFLWNEKFRYVVFEPPPETDGALVEFNFTSHRVESKQLLILNYRVKKIAKVFIVPHSLFPLSWRKFKIIDFALVLHPLTFANTHIIFPKNCILQLVLKRRRKFIALKLLKLKLGEVNKKKREKKLCKFNWKQNSSKTNWNWN